MSVAPRAIAVRTQVPSVGQTLRLPGFVTAHSHAFQRGLRGQAQRAPHDAGTFWSWRESMYKLAESLTPESIYSRSRAAFAELALRGVVAVGEFHYVHHQPDGTPYEDRTIMSDAVIRAALDSGLSIALLRVAYARAGAGRAAEGAQRRFCDPEPSAVIGDVDTLLARWRHEPRVRIGLAPHSVRAVPREWLQSLAREAERRDLTVHMHVAEQIAEVDACRSEHGRRPVQLLAECGLLSRRFCAVHATQVDESEARLLGGAESFACICPTTERDLGDGLAPLDVLRREGVRLCVGVDSHVISDHIEEIRSLETHERLRLCRRVTFVPEENRTPAEQLTVDGSIHGAQAIGFDASVHGKTVTMAASTHIVLEHEPSLAGVSDETLLDAAIFSGSALRFVTETTD